VGSTGSKAVESVSHPRIFVVHYLANSSSCSSFPSCLPQAHVLQKTFQP